MRTLTDADRTASREVTLTADFAPHPENVVWENLGVSATSRYVRSTIVNGILLLQICVSTYAITEVTNRNVDVAIDSEATLGTKVFSSFSPSLS